MFKAVLCKEGDESFDRNYGYYKSNQGTNEQDGDIIFMNIVMRLYKIKTRCGKHSWYS